MFQHRVPSADNILSQAMRMTDLDRLPMSYGMGAPCGGSKDRRADSVGNQAGNHSGYDHMWTQPTAGGGGDVGGNFVILSRAELESLKQEIAGLKHSMVELRNVISGEIEALRVESESLRQQVEAGRCLCKEGGCHRERRGGGATLEKKNPWQQQSPAWEGGSLCVSRGVDIQPIGCSSARTPALSDHGTDGSAIGYDSSLTPVTAGAPTGFGLCGSNSDAAAAGSLSDHKPLTQLLPNYDVRVNKLTLQITVNEAQTRKQGAALYVLRRLIPLVFSWEELAASRGQGLHCKATDDGSNKCPLDPTRVLACKAYMRKFCMEYGCQEPAERAVNQTFNHQVNYARRRIRGYVPLGAVAMAIKGKGKGRRPATSKLAVRHGACKMKGNKIGRKYMQM